MSAAAQIALSYVETRVGRIHFAECGSGPPLICLHQTPRSWDEYRETLPVLGLERRAVAMDTLGMGGSAAPRPRATIEAYAEGVLAVADALAIARFALVGHHTGGVIAMEVAASCPDRVDALVLSSTPWVDAESRSARRTATPIDALTARGDGDHLVDWWHRRGPLYPPDRPDLMHRCLRDALAARDPQEGHQAVGEYRMEERVASVRAPTLCVGHDQDPHAYPQLAHLLSRLPGAEKTVIRGGRVALEYTAAEFADLVLDFLRRVTR